MSLVLQANTFASVEYLGKDLGTEGGQGGPGGFLRRAGELPSVGKQPLSPRLMTQPSGAAAGEPHAHPKSRLGPYRAQHLACRGLHHHLGSADPAETPPADPSQVVTLQVPGPPGLVGSGGRGGRALGRAGRGCR